MCGSATSQGAIATGTKKKTVQVKMFDSAEDARTAIRGLRDAGLRENEIGLLTHDAQGNPEVTTFKDMEGRWSAADPVVCQAHVNSLIPGG